MDVEDGWMVGQTELYRSINDIFVHPSHFQTSCYFTMLSPGFLSPMGKMLAEDVILFFPPRPIFSITILDQ